MTEQTFRFCAAHTCRWGLHAFVCKRVPSQITRHHSIISRAFASARIPVVKEPTRFSRSYGQRLDGLTLIPWQRGQSLTWDVTVATTLADSYTQASASSAGTAAEMAASRRLAKYVSSSSAYLVHPIALETLGPIN